MKLYDILNTVVHVDKAARLIYNQDGYAGYKAADGDFIRIGKLSDSVPAQIKLLRIEG